MALPLRLPARRFMAVLSLTTLALVAFAPAAGADGVRPTNFRSQIDSIEPKVSGVDIQVLGSEAFLEVTAEPGVRVRIPGYEGEPYLRIDADGTVWRNRNSPATFVNSSRSGRTAIPRDLPGAATPDWEKAGSGGSVAWHDHRIHWMSSEVPDTGRDGLVNRWEVPLTVDGTETTIHGSLYRQGNQFPWPVLITLVFAGALFLVFRRFGRNIAALTLALSAAVALTTTALVQLADPPNSGTSATPLVLAGLALVSAFAAMTPGSRPPMFRITMILGAVALLVGWMIPLMGTFWMPYVPSVAPGALIKVMTALVAGGVIAVTAAALIDPMSLDRRDPTVRRQAS